MPGKGTHIFGAILAVAFFGFIASFAVSDDTIVPTPDIPKAEGGRCVASPEFMRTNHMVMLKHDRDLKLQDGVSNIDYSLKECVACHAVRDDAGAPVSYDSPEHFCRSCHDYAAVKIDCFTCHNSKPEEKSAFNTANPHANPNANRSTYKFEPINWLGNGDGEDNKGKPDE